MMTWVALWHKTANIIAMLKSGQADFLLRFFFLTFRRPCQKLPSTPYTQFVFVNFRHSKYRRFIAVNVDDWASWFSILWSSVLQRVEQRSAFALFCSFASSPPSSLCVELFPTWQNSSPPYTNNTTITFTRASTTLLRTTIGPGNRKRAFNSEISANLSFLFQRAKYTPHVAA